MSICELDKMIHKGAAGEYEMRFVCYEQLDNYNFMIGCVGGNNFTARVARLHYCVPLGGREIIVVIAASEIPGGNFISAIRDATTTIEVKWSTV